MAPARKARRTTARRRDETAIRKPQVHTPAPEHEREATRLKLTEERPPIAARQASQRRVW